jgi:nickel transport protein
MKAKKFPYLAVLFCLFAGIATIAATVAMAMTVDPAEKVLNFDRPAIAATGERTNCQVLTAAMEENQAAISRDLRQIKRDLAKLEQKLDQPGISQIFAGIGYIFGLCGVAAFVASRKNRGR